MMKSSCSVLMMTIAMLGCGEYGAAEGPPDAGPPTDAGAGVLDAGATGVRDAVLPSGPSSSSYTLAPTLGGYASFGAASTVGADGSVNVAGGVWNVPVPAEVGRSVGTITIPVRDNALVSGASGHESNVVSASLVLHSSAAETTLAVAASSGTGVWQTITLTATPHAIVSGESLVLRLSPQTTTAPPHFASVWSTVGIAQVADSRSWVRQTLPATMFGTAAQPTIAINPAANGQPFQVWKMSSNQTVRFRIDGWNPGDRITDIQLDVFGNGTSDMQFFSLWESHLDGSGPSVQLSSTGTSPLPDIASGWTRIDLGATGPGIIPTTTTAGSAVLGALILSGGGGDVYLGDVLVTVER